MGPGTSSWGTRARRWRGPCVLAVAVVLGAALPEPPAARGLEAGVPGDSDLPPAAPEITAGTAPAFAPAPAGDLPAGDVPDAAPGTLRGHPPFMPHILSVTADPKTPLTRFYTLVEPFTDPDGPGEATATDWRIATVPPPGEDAPRTVYHSAAGAPPGAAPDLLLLPPGVLAPDRHYALQVRFMDGEGNWSPWSGPAPMLMPPPAPAPHAGHRAPPRLIRFTADVGTVVPMGELTMDDLDPAHRPDGTFLYGLAALCIGDLTPGATAIVLYTLPGRPPEGFRWVHHHPGSGLTDRTDRTRVHLDTISESLTDGGEGDADGVANGVILATVGLLVPGPPPAPEVSR